MNYLNISSSIGLILCILFLETSSEISSKRGKREASAQGVVGQKAKIPCSIHLSDDVTVVLWEKDGEQIYSLDKRGVPVTKAKHHTQEGRLDFLPLERPPSLLLKDLRPGDQGSYKCLVMFKKKTHETFETTLKVIVPPRSIQVFDRAGKEITEGMEPVYENNTAEFTCQVTGGRPVPLITWWKGAELLDKEVESEGTKVLRNVVRVGPLTRDDQGKEIVCQSSNSNLTEPLSRKITLEVYYPPLNVEITTSKASLEEGKEYQIICQSEGSRPPAIINWFLGGTKLKDMNSFLQKPDNTTKSILKYVPSRDDIGKALECRAESPVIATKPLTESWSLDILYTPIVKLEMVPTEDVTEGSDVSFTCNIVSNPSPSNITWFHKGRQIEAKDKNKFAIEDNTLNLYSVTRSMSGMYTCVAFNQVGPGESNPQVLQVKYVPVCTKTEVQIVGASMKEEISIRCSLHASPKAISFRWQFSNSAEAIDIAEDSYTVEEKDSILTYKPITPLDFGNLMCWGTNELGEQSEPCTFQLVEASLPEKPVNCTFFGNFTSSAVFVRCAEGHDGGLPQMFIAEVFDMSKNTVIENVSIPEPHFLLDNLPSGTDFMLTIYSANVKGPSETQMLQVYTAAPTEKSLFSINSTHIFPITPILGVLIGVVGALVVVSVIIAVVMRLRTDPTQKKPLKDDSNGVRRPLHPNDGGEIGDNDGIPSKLKHVNLYETVAYESSDSQLHAEVQGDSTSDKETDDIEYAELNFNNSKKKSKSKKMKTSSKPNGKIHNSYDPTLYVSIDHVQTEKKKLAALQKELQQQQQQQKLINQQIEEQHQTKNLQKDFSHPKQQFSRSSKMLLSPSPPPPFSDNEPPHPTFNSPEAKIPNPGTLQPPDKLPGAPPKSEENHQRGTNHRSIPVSVPPEIGAKKTPKRLLPPTGLEKPPIAKKPVFVQELIRNKKTVETQTPSFGEVEKGSERNFLSADATKEDIPLMDSATESSL